MGHRVAKRMSLGIARMGHRVAKRLVFPTKEGPEVAAQVVTPTLVIASVGETTLP